MTIALMIALLSLTAVSAIGGQIDAETSESATPWTGLTANDAEEDFHFVVVSDRTGGARPGVFESSLPKVNLLEPAFVVSVGDLIEGYTEDQDRLDAEWDEIEGFVDQLEVPFFYVAGNHDMNNAVMAETWRVRFGPSYYRFVYKNVLFLVLNSELFGMVSDPDKPVPGPWTQAEQLAFVERTLREVPDPHWTIVLVHQPLWDYRDGPRGDWPAVEQMLGGRDYTVFAGHFHRYVKHVRNDRRYITLATTGGGSSLRGTPFGEFDHVAWVTMTANGPRIANLMLDGIHDENVVTAARRAAIGTMASAVRSLPAFGGGQMFDSGIVAFEVGNGGADDMRVAFNVAPGPDLIYRGRRGSQSHPARCKRAGRIELGGKGADPLCRHHPRASGLVAVNRQPSGPVEVGVRPLASRTAADPERGGTGARRRLGRLAGLAVSGGRARRCRVPVDGDHRHLVRIRCAGSRWRRIRGGPCRG